MIEVLKGGCEKLLLVQICGAASINTLSQFHRRQSAIESLEPIGIALWIHFRLLFSYSLQGIIG